MRVPLSWLGEFVSGIGAPGALAERLTMAGLAVAAIEEVGRLQPAIRVGRLIGLEPHPAADGLFLCQVDVGGAGRAVVVSGAPGLAVGQLVPIALPGARLADGKETAAIGIRGIESAGVLCSE